MYLSGFESVLREYSSVKAAPTVIVPRVRRMDPFSCGLGINRDNILMAGEEQGLQRRIRSLPVVGQVISVDLGEVQLLMAK